MNAYKIALVAYGIPLNIRDKLEVTFPELYHYINNSNGAHLVNCSFTHLIYEVQTHAWVLIKPDSNKWLGPADGATSI